jgi:hypothetical protein
MSTRDKNKKYNRKKLDNLEKLLIDLTCKIEKQNNMIGILAKYLKDEKYKLIKFENELEKCKAQLKFVSVEDTTIVIEDEPVEEKNMKEDEPVEEKNMKEDEPVEEKNMKEDEPIIEQELCVFDNENIYGWMKSNHIAQFENLFEECQNL